MNRIFTLITMCVFAIGAAFAEETTIEACTATPRYSLLPLSLQGLSRSRLKKAIQPQNLPISSTRVLRKCAFTVVIKKANLKATL